MSRWFRSLPAVVRGSVYFVGVVLAFLVAVGVGATATVVAGWGEFGRVAIDLGELSPLSGPEVETTGPEEMSALESTALETTGPAEAPESTGIEPSEDSDDFRDMIPGTLFLHRADQENSRENYTVVDDVNINGNANAVVLILSAADGEGAGGAPYGRNYGVRYEPEAERWAIFNQDRGPVPEGATFEVGVPSASAGFVHRAEPLDTVGNATYLNGPATNGKPDVTIFVTQNWNPGGGEGVYNDHPAGAFYDDDVDQWAIYNKDGASMPEGAAFNVAVSAGESESTR